MCAARVTCVLSVSQVCAMSCVLSVICVLCVTCLLCVSYMYVCVVGGKDGGVRESGGKGTGGMKEGREVLGWVGAPLVTPRGGSTDMREESPALPLQCSLTGSESHV